MDFGIALLGRLVNFNRLDIQRYEQDTDITAGWETDMFLDTASPDDAISVSSSQTWEDWACAMSRLTVDRRCWVAAPLTDMKHQEGHELFSCAQHEDRPRKDLRSASIEYKRDADQGHKYYYFKAVKLGDVGQAYYTALNATSRFVGIGIEELPADRSEARIEVWTKRTLFVQAQGYPRPPQHHHHCRGCQEGKDAWLKRQVRTRDIRQILKVAPADLYEEDRLIDLDVMSDNVRDDWYDPSEAHDQSYAKVVEERNNKVLGEILDRAMTKWKNRGRCESSRAALSVAPPELS